MPGDVLSRRGFRSMLVADRVFPFSSSSRCMSVIVINPADGSRMIMMKGAPDVMAHSCLPETRFVCGFVLSISTHSLHMQFLPTIVTLWIVLRVKAIV